MKKFSKITKFVTTLIAASFVFAVVSCNSVGGGNKKYAAGTYTSTAKGFHGDVNVKMTFTGSKIKDVVIDADETPGIGSRAVELLPKAILDAQSADVDGISGATISSNAIKMAATECIDKAIGSKGVSVKMVPGTYDGYSESFRARDGIRVKVEVSDSRILKIDVDTVNTSDVPPIIEAAAAKIPARIIEHQSLAVDAMAGCTVSSNAIKAATADAVTKAIVAAGGEKTQIYAFYKSIPKSNKTETINTEVLVIGMGGSGMAASLSAAQSGAKVLAIDKAGKFGGTTALTSQFLSANPPVYKAEHNGGKDYVDAEGMYKDWLEYCKGDAKAELVRKEIFESGKVLDWLIANGAVFEGPRKGLTASDPYTTNFFFTPGNVRYNKREINSYLTKLWGKFEAAGGKYMLETEGYELIYDKATNKVKGAKARSLVDGTEYVINAQHVVLATGGFAGNDKMEEELLQNTYYPLKGAWKQIGSTHNDGKMFQAALDIGAGTYNISVPPEVHNSGTESWLTMDFEPHWMEGVVAPRTGRPAFWTEGDFPAWLGWSFDSLVVDGTGKRFTSETGVATFNSWSSGPNFYSIWSQEQIDKIAREGFDSTHNGSGYLGSGNVIPNGMPIPNVPAVLEAAENRGILVKANSVAELAKKMNMPNLVATVDKYNGFCEAGVDSEFKKPAEFLDKIGAGPYYCIIMASYCYGTCGGLDINENFEVLKTDGRTPIDGLYAIGSDAMGVLFSEKQAYVTYGGANNSWGMTSGYLAGKEIARKLGK